MRTLNLLLLAVFIQMLMPLSAQAELLFQRSHLVIYPEAEIDIKNTKQVILRPEKPLKLNVQIRDAASFQTPSLYLSNMLDVNEAYLVSLPGEAHKELNPANVYTAIDVMALNTEGRILKIWPSVRLNELRSPLKLPKATHAVLYMRGNRFYEIGIMPGDRVEHALFTPSPESLQ